ncbi:protein of unknown function [Palleronia marisminoris]|uniref:DUF4260 domain-containing protein n=1 Tax=Palleronia marisminoris TaxID=315423 RepID=A0A1Y5TN71_9RHOB|nr:DUF4260 domain-containing protein [Palleronia marisminoris]SFH45804.1 protein of unknown function [Palleronia marisminoris]SLN68084.1 hypothetical protein PAM7066_03426 [Palleronia marisminoris]
MNTQVEFGGTERGYATGMVLWLLRLEALAILAASTTFFFLFDGRIWMFAILFFAPDLSIAGYTLSTKAGAVLYNAAHSYAPHILLAVAGVLVRFPTLWQIALIFLAHAAFDRSLSYGLKYAAGFRHTHLGQIGAKPRRRLNSVNKQRKDGKN